MVSKTTLKQAIKEWDDEELLSMFGLFLDRVEVSSTFLRDGPDGVLTHEALVFQANDKVLISDPRELDWPLMPVLTELLKDEEEVSNDPNP